MTVKEIAIAVGREERAVHNWVKLLSAKNAEVYAKIAQAKATSKAAEYTLAETCLIIEEGLGKAAADVYRMNAATTEAVKKPAKMSGAFLAEINKSFDRQILTKDEARALIGLGPEIKKEPIMISGNIGNISKQAYAVEMKVREKEQAKKDARGMKSLFDDEAGK